MQKDNIEIQDNITANPAELEPSERKEYEVLAETGLYKNGKLYKIGDKITLDTTTAKHFEQLKEVKLK